MRFENKLFFQVFGKNKPLISLLSQNYVFSRVDHCGKRELTSVLK